MLGPQLPVPEPSKSDGTAERRPIKSEASHAAEFSLPHTEESDSDETVSDETVSNETIPPADAVGRVLNYTLDAVFGLANDDAVHVPSVCSIVANFISDMAWAIDKALGQKQAPGYVCAADLSRQPTSASTSSAGTNSSNRSSPSSDKGKRKAQDGGEDDQDGDDERDERDNKRKGSGPSKRPKPNSFRMSCPFRKKNPLRFNVRDYRLCALTVFTDTAELRWVSSLFPQECSCHLLRNRRHIQDVHRRPAINHQCPRCQSQFSTQDEFADHLRSADICSLVETRLGSEDPEDGVDEAIVNTLRSKKGRVSDPVRVQWQKIWELLFPGTPVQPYGKQPGDDLFLSRGVAAPALPTSERWLTVRVSEYCAVMEHFELHEKCRSSLPHLRESLRAIGLSETGLDSLGSILDNYFIGLFEQCNEEGRQKDYRNRQPKAQQAQPRATRRSSSERTANNAHRDSAVDVGMDNEVVPDENAQSKPDGPEPDDLLLGQLQPLPDEHAGDPVIDSFYILDPAVFGDGRGDILLPGEADSAALDGQQQHDPGYATDPGDSTGHRTGSNANLDGTFPAHNLGYQSWQQDPARLVGQWDSVMLEYGGSMTEPDLNAWLYAQPGSRAV